MKEICGGGGRNAIGGGGGGGGGGGNWRKGHLSRNLKVEDGRRGRPGGGISSGGTSGGRGLVI